MSEAGIWDSGDGSLLRERQYILHSPLFEKGASRNAFFWKEKFRAQVSGTGCSKIWKILPDMFTF